MAAEAIKMVTESVDSYVRQDMDQAREVIEHDDIVDAYFISIWSISVSSAIAFSARALFPSFRDFAASDMASSHKAPIWISSFFIRPIWNGLATKRQT